MQSLSSTTSVSNYGVIIVTAVFVALKCYYCSQPASEVALLNLPQE